MANIPEVTLNNGLKMPLEGFGVFQIPESQCKKAVLEAISSGYRLIDTAQDYSNEKAVGKAIKESPVSRSDIFLTTKVSPLQYAFQKDSYQKTKDSVLESLKKLQTNYLDLVLLHMPFGDIYSAYRALEDLYHKGTLKSIGISNFYADKYIDFVNTVSVTPVINQVETNVFHQRKTLRKYLTKYHTQIESWSPFAEGNNHFFTNPTLVRIGKKYQKSSAQIALRFLTQNKIIIIPKSTHKNRMQENLRIWDFELSSNEMQAISKLDLGKSQVGEPPAKLDHENPQVVEMFRKVFKKGF